MQQQEQQAPPAFGNDLVKARPRGRKPIIFIAIAAAIAGSLVTMGIQAVARYAPLNAITVGGAVSMDGKALTEALSAHSQGTDTTRSSNWTTTVISV